MKMATATFSTIPGSPIWTATTIRVKNPEASLDYYQKRFGMAHVDTQRSNEGESYFLASLRKGETFPTPGSDEAHRSLFASPHHTMVELLREAGAPDDVQYDSGNNEPKRGFGHLAFATEDVYKAAEDLEAAGVSFKKKPDEGRMKGLAFAYDPDGYWIEIVKRAESAGFPERFNLAQTMLRIKDPEATLAFYYSLGLTKVCEKHFPDAAFSLYFLMALPAGTPVPDPTSEEGSKFVGKSWRPVLELTHNHGTEKDPEFSHHNGNSDPKGFSKLTFATDDAAAACATLETNGALVLEKCPPGGSCGVVKDPDGYHVRVVTKGAALS